MQGGVYFRLVKNPNIKNSDTTKAPHWQRMLRMIWREQQPPRLARVPEPLIVMDDPDQVKTFHEEGSDKGSIRPIYHFNALRMSQMTPLGGLVVDFGSGSGQYLRYFAQMRPDVRIIGFDLSEEMIAVGNRMLERTHLSPRVTLIKSDMTTFTAPKNERVHLISSLFALHHLPSMHEVKQCLERMARIREEQNAGVWIFDHARPSHPDTPSEFPALLIKDIPDVHRQDVQNTLTASWSFRELTELTDATHMGMFAHEKVVFLLGLYQTHHLFPRGSNLQPSKHPQRLDLQIAEIHAQSSLEQIAISTWARLWSLTKLMGQILGAALGVGITSLWDHTRRSPYLQRIVAQKLTRELGKLKGPLMKLGQITGQSAPGLSSEMRQNLRSLVDTSATIHGKIIRGIVERELKRPIDKVFEEWSDAAFASGVVGQTHFAVLKGGRPVIVKVRYPGLLDAVKSDLRLLKRMRPILRSVLGFSNIDKIYAEVHTIMLAECDFMREAKNQMAFRKIFNGDPEIVIPEVHADLCTEEVIVMEYIDGQRFREFVQQSTQEERNRAGTIIFRFAAHSIHEYCIFHADPHPGNFLFLKDKRIAFLDFGFIKRWPVEYVEHLKRQALAIIHYDLEEFAETTRQLGFVLDEGKFDFAAVLQNYRDSTALPWYQDAPFHFTPDFIYTQLNKVVTGQMTQPGAVQLPEEFFANVRLYWGLFSVLAQLGAEANWHRILLPTFTGPSYPPPPLDEMIKNSTADVKSFAG